MIPNKLKRLWADGKPTLNGWCSIGNSFTAEIMAAQGYDSVTVDLQHGALDYAGALPMLQAMRASGVVPMARVPWLEPGIIMKALDAGAYGVICPMVNTAAHAAEFISCWGFDMTTVSGDTRLLAGAAAASVARFRELVGEATRRAETGAY